MTPRTGERTGVSAHVGRITAVMRAFSAAGPRHLRIARVELGRVIEERVFDPTRVITIGRSERATFVVADAELPRERVFAFKKGHWWRAGEELEPSARGKFRVGSALFLFQLVLPPPPRTRAVLPASVLTNPVALDLRTSVVAGLSFLIHFLVAGALYSDWLDPISDEGVSVNGLSELMKTLPPPPIVEAPTEEATPAATSTPTPDAPKSVARGAKGPSASGNSAHGNAALAQALEQLELVPIGMSRGGPATAGVLDRSEIPTAALDDAAASEAGVSTGGLPNLVRGGGPLRPGQSGSLADLGRRGKDPDAKGIGEVKTARGPRGSTAVAPPITRGGLPGAEGVVAGLRPGFHACYQRALDKYPDAQGSVRLVLHVGSNGEVSNVDASPSGNMPGELVSCLVRRAGFAQFSAPEGGSAAVVVPVTVKKQN
jgi:hypothetical protein